jgi:aspartate dehydrogenase
MALKVGIVGCGNIGLELARFVHQHSAFTLHAVSDVAPDPIRRLLDEIQPDQFETFDIADLVDAVDLVIETANKEVAGAILAHPRLDRPERKLFLLSTSALLENSERVKGLKHCEVFLPSGALAGLDGIKAVSKHISSLTLTTTKPPAGLAGAPHVVETGVDLAGLRTAATIFSGGLAEAVRGFPKNVNVAATLFAASRFEDLRVKVIADPAATLNRHEVVCEGDFGTIAIRAENKPSTNPRTSLLAILSAKRTLSEMVETIHVGT